MKVTVLGSGTSQGVPVIACDCEVCRSVDYHDKRLRASIHIECQDISLIIDTGPDFRQQVLRERIQKVDAVLFTHEHKDHTAGLDDIRSFNFKHEMDMPLYAQNRVLEQLKQEYAYIFTEKTYPGIPRVELHPINKTPFSIKGVEIIPIEVHHFKLPVLGFRIEDFTYITDVNKIESSQIKKIKGCKVLILSALQQEPHVSHFTLKEAIEVAKEIDADKTFFTHVSHKMGLHKVVQKQLPANMSLAWDGLKIEL